jgi:hypothetical protein
MVKTKSKDSRLQVQLICWFFPYNPIFCIGPLVYDLFMNGHRMLLSTDSPQLFFQL